MVWCQKQMRPRPATRAASFVDSCFCLVTAWRQNDRFSPATLPLSRTKKRRLGPSELPIRHLAMTKMQPLRRPAALVSCSLPRLRRAQQQRVRWGGRNARATSRARARFLECPPAIHPRESPVAAGTAAIIRQAQELSRFAEPTFRHFVAPSNRKNFHPCAEAVDDVSSLWKPEEI
jgi:hypothetical protein